MSSLGLGALSKAQDVHTTIETPEVTQEEGSDAGMDVDNVDNGVVPDDNQTNNFFPLDLFHGATSRLASPMTGEYLITELCTLDPALRGVNLRNEIRQYLYALATGKNPLAVRTTAWPILQSDTVRRLAIWSVLSPLPN